MIHGRAPYVPSTEQPRLELPGGARLAIHLIVNVEAWRYDVKLPRQILTAPQGAEPIPDVPNFAWFEYGMRVGIFPRVRGARTGARSRDARDQRARVLGVSASRRARGARRAGR